MHPFKRILKLYITFWIVFLLFIPLGHFLNPELYPLHPSIFLANLFAIDYSYNHEWWFLFPYFLLVLSFRPFTSLISRFTPKQNCFFFILLCLLHVTHGPLLAHLPDFSGKQILIGYLTTLTPFITGIFFSHYNLFYHCTLRLSLSHSKHKNTILLLLLTLLLLLRMMLGPSILNPLFIVPFIILFLLKHPPILCRILQYFGHHSTHIWLTHTFFSYYLFSTFIYGCDIRLLSTRYCSLCPFCPPTSSDSSTACLHVRSIYSFPDKHNLQQAAVHQKNLLFLYQLSQ